MDVIDVGWVWTDDSAAPPPPVGGGGRRSKKPFPYWSWLLPLLSFLR